MKPDIFSLSPGDLSQKVATYIARAQPRTFVVENVKGFVSKKQANQTYWILTAVASNESSLG